MGINQETEEQAQEPVTNRKWRIEGDAFDRIIKKRDDLQAEGKKLNDYVNQEAEKIKQQKRELWDDIQDEIGIPEEEREAIKLNLVDDFEDTGVIFIQEKEPEADGGISKMILSSLREAIEESDDEQEAA